MLGAPLNPRSSKGSGKIPHRYTFDELEDLGVNISELCQITLQTAPFYSFHTSSSDLVPSTQIQHLPAPADCSSPPKALGPTEALEHLNQTGRFATRKWVDNHWVMVLWKLAGLVALDPDAERDPSTRRWCWPFVLQQLEARHDKEFERGARPTLRMITTQDKPSGCPMVLLVSEVLWAQHERVGEDGRVEEPAGAEIEVSDGWYRLKAQVDPPLARAVLRGLIKSGRKLAISGARVSSVLREIPYALINSRLSIDEQRRKRPEGNPGRLQHTYATALRERNAPRALVCKTRLSARAILRLFTKPDARWRHGAYDCLRR